jgi:nucleotide-binding universal stress UspA family protein
MIRRILCPTNLQAGSQYSVAYGFRLAKENHAELVVFHATSFPSLYLYACEMDDYFQWQQMARAFTVDHVLGDAERRVRNFVTTKLPNESKEVAWSVKVALGNPAEEITHAAFQEETDLVVMGRSKKGQLAHLIARSISETVVRSVPCPVLSVDATQFYYPDQGWRLPGLKQLFQNG